MLYFLDFLQAFKIRSRDSALEWLDATSWHPGSKSFRNFQCPLHLGFQILEVGELVGWEGGAILKFVSFRIRCADLTEMVYYDVSIYHFIASQPVFADTESLVRVPASGMHNIILVTHSELFLQASDLWEWSLNMKLLMRKRELGVQLLSTYLEVDLVISEWIVTKI